MNFFKNFRLVKKSEASDATIIPASVFEPEVTPEPAKSAYEIAREAAEAAEEGRAREIYEGMQASARLSQQRGEEEAARIEKSVNFEYSFGENGKPNSLGSNGVVFTGNGKTSIF